MEPITQQPFELTPFELTKEYLEKLQVAISQEDNEFIRTEMDELYPPDITNILDELNGDEAHYLVKLLDTKLAAEIITNLDTDDRKKFLKNFTSQEIAQYIDEISLGCSFKISTASSESISSIY